MTQKLTAIAAIGAALIIALALVYHGRELAKLSSQLTSLEQRNRELDLRLQTFSAELPAVIEQAGRNAGQQAVHGIFEEAVLKPLSWLGLTPAQATAASFTPVAPQLHTNGLSKNPGLKQSGLALAEGAANPLMRVVQQNRTNNSTADPGLPTILFDISQPVVQFETSVQIEILPGLKKLPDLPWLPEPSKTPPSVSTNQP